MTLARGRSSRIADVSTVLSAGFLVARSRAVGGEGRCRGSSHVNALKIRLRMPNIGRAHGVVATIFRAGASRCPGHRLPNDGSHVRLRLRFGGCRRGPAFAKASAGAAPAVPGLERSWGGRRSSIERRAFASGANFANGQRNWIPCTRHKFSLPFTAGVNSGARNKLTRNELSLIIRGTRNKFNR
jgi:hypothetical protein